MARKNGKDRGIFQRPNRTGWWVQLVVDGRRRTYGASTKTKAKALYTRLRGEVLERRFDPEKYRAGHVVTVSQWVVRCLEGSTNRDKKKERQRAEYWSTLWGTRAIKDLSFEDLRQHQAKMLASGDYAPATVNRYFSSLRRMFTLAVHDGVVNRHPMHGLKFLPEVQRDRFFSDAELHHLQQLLSTEEWRAVAIALGTGLRLSEQFTLSWKQVNEEGRTLTIPLPKGGKTRRVPISEDVMHLLQEQFSSSPWVFPDAFDPMQPQDPYPVSDRFSDRLARAGITGASWHCLRHTFASRLLLRGADIVTVSKLLGHSTLQTTMRYVHLVKDQLHQAVNLMSVSQFVGEGQKPSGTTTTTTTKPKKQEGTVKRKARKSLTIGAGGRD